MRLTSRLTQRLSSPLMVDVLIILVLGLAVLTWFRGTTIILTSASVWPLNWHMFLEKTLSIWDDSIGTGEIASRQIAALPLALVGALAEYVGMSPSLFQTLLFYGWFAGSGLAMLWLCTVFGWSRIARLTASIAYMVSPVALLIVWSQTDGLLMPMYVGLPLGLALFARILLKHRPLTEIFMANIVLLLSLSTTYQNPTYALLFWIPLLLLAVGHIGLWPRSWRYVARTTILFGVVWLLLNAFSLLPLVGSLADEFAQASHTIIQAEDPTRIFRSDIDTYDINSVKAVDGLRLTGLWSLTGQHESDPYYVWGALYNSLPLRIVSFVFPLLIAVVLTVHLRKPAVVFFSLIFIGSVFAILGTHAPGEHVRLAMNHALPALLRAFRAVYAKWGLLAAMSYAPLVGLGIDTVYTWARRATPWLGRACLVVLVGVVVGLGWPVWFGSIINPGGDVLQAARVRIPDFYRDLQAWEARESDPFRLLPLPLSKTGSTAYHWVNGSGYVGGDFIRWFSPHHPVLFAGTRNPLILAVIDMITDGRSTLPATGLERVLGLLNVRYVLMHHDFYWLMNRNFMMFNDETALTAFLERPLWQSLNHFGDLELLAPQASASLPKVYATSALAYVVSSGAHIADILVAPSLPYPVAIYIYNPNRPTADDVLMRQAAHDIFLTTSFDEEALAQARRDLSDARAERSPFIPQREVALERIERTLAIADTNSLIIPREGTYVALLSARALTDRAAPVRLNITDANGQTYELSKPVVSYGEDTPYISLGSVTLAPGSLKMKLLLGDRTLSSIPPGTILLHQTRSDTVATGPTVSFQPVSPTDYRGHISASQQPFMLVFSETFHPGWAARVEQADGTTLAIPPSRHYEVNGYANGWWFDGTESGDLRITFKPQRWVWLGLGISLLTSAVGMILLVRFLMVYASIRWFRRNFLFRS